MTTYGSAFPPANTVILAANATAVSIPVDGVGVGWFNYACRIVSNGTLEVFMLPNGLTTGCAWRLLTDGVLTTGTLDLRMGSLGAVGRVFTAHGRMFLGATRIAGSGFATQEGTVLYEFGHDRFVGSENITSMSFATTDANGLGAGSTFSFWPVTLNQTYGT